MNDGIKKFEELIRTDEAFREKLKAAAEAYNGEPDEKAVFEQVLSPVAGEYGITATYEEFSEYIHSLQQENAEIADGELEQVAGGTKGAGATACWVVGVGLGGSSADKVPNLCVAVGVGTPSACAGQGATTGLGL